MAKASVILAGTLSLLISSAPVAARGDTVKAYASGYELLDWCSGSRVPICLSYLMGTLDTLNQQQKINNNRDFCSPDVNILLKLKDLLVTNINKDHSLLDAAAPSVIQLTLIKYFPCR